MLKTRILTAVALLPVVLGMLFLSGAAAWAIFAAAIAMVSNWEWSRMCGFAPRAQGLYLAASVALGGALVAAALRAPPALFANVAEASFIAAAFFWVFAVPAWLALRWRPEPWAAGIAGWLVVWPMWSALVALRAASPWALLAVAVIVWLADIAAYFAGRRFGRHKLAPAISPGKTWEGVAGAVVAVLAYGLALDVYAHSATGRVAGLFAAGWGVPTVLAMAALAALSVLGDLFESWMKRGAGLKDSSNLLPGHGGVLDRIDALTPTLPVAALLLSLT